MFSLCVERMVDFEISLMMRVRARVRVSDGTKRARGAFSLSSGPCHYYCYHYSSLRMALRFYRAGYIPKGKSNITK